MGGSSMDSNRIKDIVTQWVEKVVIGQNICPFAKGETYKTIIVEGSDHSFALKRSEELIKEFAGDSEKGYLIVFPELRDNFIQFFNFSALIEEEVAARGLNQDIQVVTFHPSFRFEGEKSSAVGNYVNRSPFPLVHLLNFKEVTKVMEKYGERVGEEISENNNKKLKGFTAREFQEKIGQYCEGFWPLSEGSDI